MKQNNLLNLLNKEFPMHPAYLAFRASPDGGARFTNPMEWHDNITYFTVYAEGERFRVVEQGWELFPKHFNDLDQLCVHIQKLGRLQRRMNEKQKLEAELRVIEAQNLVLRSKIAELKREIAFYN